MEEEEEEGDGARGAARSVGAYVPPAARASQSRGADTELGGAGRQLIGLLNRLSEARLETSAREIADLIRSGRQRAMSQARPTSDRD